MPCLVKGWMSSHENENFSTIQGDPQEEHVRGVQHDAPHEGQHVHIAQVIADLLQPVQMLGDGISTDGHHAHQARAGQSWRGQHQSELPPTPGHTSDQAILAFYVQSLTDHRFLFNNWVEIFIFFFMLSLYSFNFLQQVITFMVKNEKINILKTGYSKLYFSSYDNKSFVRLQMNYVILVINHKSVIFHVYYIPF